MAKHRSAIFDIMFAFQHRKVRLTNFSQTVNVLDLYFRSQTNKILLFSIALTFFKIKNNFSMSTREDKPTTFSYITNVNDLHFHGHIFVFYYYSKIFKTVGRKT